MALDIFPVAGGATYTDDFGAPRSNGRTHQGNDLFAPLGTAVVMPSDGTVAYYTDGIGGPSFTARFDDGSRAYGTHLSGYAFDVALGADTRQAPRRVRAGEVIGYVGKGGNASGTPPHLHFQYWLAGGQLVDPYEHLRAARVVGNLPGPLPAKPPPSASAGETLALAVGLVAVAGAFALAVRKLSARGLSRRSRARGRRRR